MNENAEYVVVKSYERINELKEISNTYHELLTDENEELLSQLIRESFLAGMSLSIQWMKGQL